jgi:hypothetical protein
MVHAFRSIASYPITALVAVLSLAAGIGATTATLTIRNVIFCNPPPLYQQPAQLSRVQTGRADRPNLPAGSPVPGPLYTTWRDTLGLPIAAATPARGVKDVRAGNRTDTVPVRAVTAEFFSVLGINAEAGQLFTASTRQTTGVVLSHRLWQRLFDGTAPLIPLIAIGMRLTTAGLYGVLAFAIARRSRELAVRIAIGATGRNIIGLVSAQSLRPVSVGTALGVAVMFALRQVVRANGAAGSPFDPSWPAFAIPVLIVAAIGALATWVPSRRALKIDPASLLRTL